MRVLIVGTGTIAKPLIRLCLIKRKKLGITELIFNKHQPLLESRGTLKDFHDMGAKLSVFPEKMAEFRDMLFGYGFGPDYTFSEAIDIADVVIDCTDKGIARKLKEEYYFKQKGGKLFIAQGSEKGFGIPYAFDINDAVLMEDEPKYLQIVSCNTHQVLCLLKTLAFDPENAGPWNFDNLVRARFDITRRAADISQEDSTIGIRVGEPSDLVFGTHQGKDAHDVLNTLTEKTFDIHTTADISNNCFTHVVNFRVTLKEKVSRDEIERRFRINPLTAITYLMDNNRVFSEGRDRGFSGRILNQTVVCLPSLEVREDGHKVIGRCFTPQDGNPLLSSVAALLWSQEPFNYRQKLKNIFFKRPFLFDEV
ncbi:MAG: hypothetical protein Q8Q06_02415 [bacterium]|nr:hypothetical protein [bacterium]